MIAHYLHHLRQAGRAIVLLATFLCLPQSSVQAQTAPGESASKTRETAAKPANKSAQAGTRTAAASCRWRKPLPPPIVRAHTADKQFAQTASRDQIGSERGTQFLLDAAYFGFDDVVLLLLNRGANPNGRPDSDTPPLFFALYGNRPSTIQLLLARGADPNGRDASGDTTLLHCLRVNNLAIARLLLAKGAKPELANKQGQSPLSYAKDTNNAPAVQMLSNPGAMQ